MAYRLDGLRVLVVDDRRDSRFLLALILEMAGASVISATSRDEACAIIQAMELDVVVSDIHLQTYGIHAHGPTVPPEARGSCSRAVAVLLDRSSGGSAERPVRVSPPVGPAQLVEAIVRLRGE